MLEQLRVAQPQLVITLGAPVIKFFAPLAPELTKGWSGVTSLHALDQRGRAFVLPVNFPGVAHTAAIVALTHPAYRHVNVRRRRFDGLEGDAAEVALLQEALSHAGGRVLTGEMVKEHSRSTG